MSPAPQPVQDQAAAPIQSLCGSRRGPAHSARDRPRSLPPPRGYGRIAARAPFRNLRDHVGVDQETHRSRSRPISRERSGSIPSSGALASGPFNPPGGVSVRSAHAGWRGSRLPARDRQGRWPHPAPAAHPPCAPELRRAPCSDGRCFAGGHAALLLRH